jgi:hypothetical protein
MIPRVVKILVVVELTLNIMYNRMQFVFEIIRHVTVNNKCKALKKLFKREVGLYLLT